MSDDIQYPDHFIERLHLIWGEGFLSPGGPEEVREIVKGLDLSGKVVLDIGFGTGGPAIALARDHHAARVIGTDVESQLYDRAHKNVDKAGVADKVELRIVEPGPFVFDDESFDVVFSKDSIIHIEDKPALFKEIIRILRPGGVFAASDWLSSDNEAEKSALDGYRKISHLSFELATAKEMESALADAGFEGVESKDRNAWYAAACSNEQAQIEGPLKQQLIDSVGEEIFSKWLHVRKSLTEAVNAGGLRPTHLRGIKPNA